MFKSIRWKITALFIIFIIAAELVLGTAGIIANIEYYHYSFSSAMNSVFTDDLITELNTLAGTGNITIQKTDENGAVVSEEIKSSDSIRDTINSYLSALSIGGSRFYAILDGRSGSVLSASSNAGNITSTSSILRALNGEKAMEIGLTSGYMDFALPLVSENNTEYIVYIYDDCSAQKYVTDSMFKILIYTVLASAVLALFGGLTLSRSITGPIKQLTQKAKKLADGDINALEESPSDDEIGRLTNSLVYLAHSRKESNEKARGEQIKVETILQNMNDGILAFDLKGRLIHINPEAQRLLNRNYLDDIQFDRFFKEINAGITLGDLIYMKPHGSVEKEIKFGKQYLQLNFATFNTENKVGGIIVIIHDVTKQEKLEQSRRDFVADVSHELRTPLTTIKSYSETLSDMPEADRELQVRFLDVIASEADRMARIISDLLTLSELDENQVHYKVPEAIDVRNVIESIVERMGMTAKKREQTLIYHPLNEVPIIMGDRDGFERIIMNIVSNALKYTPSGGKIEVYTSKVYKDKCIKVVDNGIGIPKEKLPNIFDRFYRVDKARSRDTGGTGLGLAIAKQTLETAFNGKIKIASELNKGTEVTITIPVQE